MQDLFYITEVHPQWYNLLVKGTHYCIACGSDLEKIKRTIHKYVRKYKVEDRVYRTLQESESGGKVSQATFTKRQEDYLSGKHEVFNDLVRGVVLEALKENRQDTPYHHVKKRLGTSLSPHTVERTTPQPPPQEVRSVKKITPRKITRTTT